jgi:elongation factor Ts
MGADGEITMNDELTKELDEVRITTGENISMARGTKLSGGSFASYIHHDSKLGVLLQFDGTLPEDIATGICQHIAANVPTPMAVDETDLPGDLVALKAGEAKADAENSGKPPEIAAKIAEGKMRKFLEDNTLIGQKHVKLEKETVGQILPAGVKILHFARMRVGADATEE